MVEEYSESNLFTKRKEKPAKEASDAVLHQVSNTAEKRPTLSVDSRRPVINQTNSYNYSVEQVNVCPIPLSTGNLVLTAYMRRSLNAILGMNTDQGYPIYYLGDIKNNRISDGPYLRLTCIFDTRTFSVYRAQNPIGNFWLCVDQYGAVTKKKPTLDSPVFRCGYFIFNNAKYDIPTDNFSEEEDNLKRIGDTIVAIVEEKRYLICNAQTTALGFSLETDKEGSLSVQIEGCQKELLLRPSIDILQVRDISAGEEEYVTMKSRLVFSTEEAKLFGGCLVFPPNPDAEEGSTVCTSFVPQKLQFGNKGTLKSKNVMEFVNGVLYHKERLLLCDNGNYLHGVDYDSLLDGLFQVKVHDQVLYYT